MADQPKVFCIGFHKTGTTSLYSALTTLGYRVSGTVLHKWTAERLEQEGAQRLIEIMKDFDAAEDMPWPHFYPQLDAAYPGSKFILSVRDPEKWFQSIDNHFGHQETELNAFAYGRVHARANDNKGHWLKTYLGHNYAVRSYFANRPDDFLEIDLTRGGGWAELCKFLDRPIPKAAFPQKNTSERRRSLIYRLKRKALVIVGRTPHPERLL